MAGGPAAETIMFVAAVLAAGLVAGGLSAVAGELADGMHARADDLGSKLRARFDIINDPLHVPYTDPVLTLYVSNTGSQTLYTSQFIVMIDGDASSALTFTVDGQAAETVGPGEMVEVQVGDAPGLGGDHTLLIISNGHKDRMEFRI